MAKPYSYALKTQLDRRRAEKNWERDAPSHRHGSYEQAKEKYRYNSSDSYETKTRKDWARQHPVKAYHEEYPQPEGWVDREDLEWVKKYNAKKANEKAKEDAKYEARKRELLAVKQQERDKAHEAYRAQARNASQKQVRDDEWYTDLVMRRHANQGGEKEFNKVLDKKVVQAKKRRWSREGEMYNALREAREETDESRNMQKKQGSRARIEREFVSSALKNRIEKETGRRPNFDDIYRRK